MRTVDVDQIYYFCSVLRINFQGRKKKRKNGVFLIMIFNISSAETVQCCWLDYTVTYTYMYVHTNFKKYRYIHLCKYDY